MPLRPDHSSMCSTEPLSFIRSCSRPWRPSRTIPADYAIHKKRFYMPTLYAGHTGSFIGEHGSSQAHEVGTYFGVCLRSAMYCCRYSSREVPCFSRGRRYSDTNAISDALGRLWEDCHAFWQDYQSLGPGRSRWILLESPGEKFASRYRASDGEGFQTLEVTRYIINGYVWMT